MADNNAVTKELEQLSKLASRLPLELLVRLKDIATGMELRKEQEEKAS